MDTIYDSIRAYFKDNYDKGTFDILHLKDLAGSRWNTVEEKFKDEGILFSTKDGLGFDPYAYVRFERARTHAD